ncbi:hypothetical protein H920_01449 [Fukomys damarensis]|uniref:Uncharacterized protein n=1 Tax=Fukomys damarensis TaxID=885580 RepID=A0A091E3N3_FUKDA|nr:hypothetical protein H920_01449 [Fukomys damarensis]
MFVRIEDLHLEGPKASGESQKICTGEMKNLSSTLFRDPHWSQEVMLTVKIRAPLMKAAAILNDSEVLSSSDENRLVRIRKTICSKLLLENQQATIFPLRSLFMAIRNNPQVDPPHPDHNDSVQLRLQVDR